MNIDFFWVRGKFYDKEEKKEIIYGSICFRVIYIYVCL